MKLSVIIPSYKDPLVQKTVDSLLESSTLGNEIEIIVVLDGKWLETPIRPNKRIRVIELPENRGMRYAINTGIAESEGKYIMKTDSHCLFAKGFDKILTEQCAYNWLMIPRRYSLDEINWKRDEKRHIRDYHYLSYPSQTVYGFTTEPTDWIRYGREHIKIDDTMTFQGSCWFAHKEYFMQRVGFLDDRPETYGKFAQEQLEIGLKYWLGGGKVKVNKNTWYAHLSKRDHHYKSGQYDKRVKMSSNTAKGHRWATSHWLNDEEPNMLYPFQWLIKKFDPPTWPK